jgi:hypothetical protein
MLFSSGFAYAGPYIELGIAKLDGAACVRDWKEGRKQYGCSENPFGNATIGWEYKGFSVEIEHWSSLRERDYGLNFFTFKYRYEFFK